MNHETHTDVVIITALKEEKEAVLKVLKQCSISPSEKKLGNQIVYTASLSTVANRSYQITLLAFNGMGNIEAALATYESIIDWKPTYIILTGIAAGFQKEIERKLGDVIVAEQVVYIEAGKEETSGLSLKPKVYRPSHELWQAAQNLDWHASIQTTRPDNSKHIPKALFGDVISTEKVIKNLESRQKLQSLWPASIALEMEGAGTAMAVHKSGTMGFLLVKGICDWADDNKNDHWHEYAAEAAACFVIELLKSGPFEPRVQPTEKNTSSAKISEPKNSISNLPPDDLLAQATCTVRTKDKFGTAWLVSKEGHLLTAGHLLGKDKNTLVDEVTIQFSGDIAHQAHRVAWGYDENKEIDFAVIQLVESSVNRQPLPISLVQSVTGKFTLRGHGETLNTLSNGTGEFIGYINEPNNRLFKLRSPETAESGYSGGAVFSDEAHAVVAIQTKTTTQFVGAESNTVLAMPLYRIAEYWEPLYEIAKNPDLPISPPPFINQKDEMDNILATFAPQYYFLDAPAGYGKTILLQRLKNRFQEKDYECAYVSADKYPTLPLLLKELFNEYGMRYPKDDNLGQQITRFGSLLNQKHKNNPKIVGFVLLIDLGKAPSITLINELLNTFIPRLFHNLQTMDEWFKTKVERHRFRVVVTGRYLATREEVKIKFVPSRLSPFKYEVILDLVWQYVGHLPEEQIKQIAAHIMYLSGGHPGCMAALLRLYKQKETPYPDYFLEDYQTDIQPIVREAINQIRNDIPSGLQAVMDILSPCRRINYDFIRQFMNCGLIPDGNQDKLADDLVQTYLMNRESGFLQDGITRPLLAIRLRQETSDIFLKVCQTAKEIYLGYISKANASRPDVIMVELLHQELQLGYYQLKEDTPEERLQFKVAFSVTLNEHLHALVPDWNYRERIDDFLTALNIDWEFQFIVNYFLREEIYSEQPYQELKDQVKKFRETLQPMTDPKG